MQSVIPGAAPVAVVAGSYRLPELVGTGGLGRLAVQRRAARGDAEAGPTHQPIADVALARERTIRGTRIAAALHRLHIVSNLDVAERDARGLVLEFLHSRSLGSALAEHGVLLRWRSNWTAATPFAAKMAACGFVVPVLRERPPL